MAKSPRKPAPKKAPSGRKPALAGYLQKILTARVYDVAIESLELMADGRIVYSSDQLGTRSSSILKVPSTIPM
jgi:hypothetical protein